MDSKSALILLCLIVATYAWVEKTTLNKYLLERPFIVPSGERFYHSIYTHISSKGNNKLYGLIYVAMINGEFYFGGHSEDEIETGVLKEKKYQAVFVTNYLEKIGNDKFFYLHNDMLKLEKTELVALKDGTALGDICKAAYDKMGSIDAKKNLVRFGNRIPMMFNIHDRKCIGTYDELTDRFTCANTNTGAVIKEDNFLWDPETGEYTKSNNVEVFCRNLHNFP